MTSTNTHNYHELSRPITTAALPTITLTTLGVRVVRGRKHESNASTLTSPSATPLDRARHQPISASVLLHGSAEMAPRVLASRCRDHRVTITASDLRERVLDRICNPLVGGRS